MVRIQWTAPAVLSALFLVADASAAPIVSGPTNTNPLTPVGDVYGVRFRSFNNTGGDEMYLGKNDLGVGANRVATNLTWGASQSFSFSYDGTKLTSTVGATTLNYLVSEPFNTMRIAILDRDVGDVSLTNLSLDGNPFAGTFSDPTDGSTTSYWLVTGFGPGAFTLTGTINRTGTFTNSQENTRIEISVDAQPVIPEPASIALFALVTGAGASFAYRRRKTA